MRTLLISTFSFAILLSEIGVAQTPAATQEENTKTAYLVENINNPEIFEFAFGSPDSPALALAGLKAEDTTRVNNFQNFVVTLPDFFEGNKTLAIDLNPASIFLPIDSFTDAGTHYGNASNAYKIFRRTRVTAIGRDGKEDMSDPSKSQSSLLSLGVVTSFLNASDPLAQSVQNNSGCNDYVTLATISLNNAFGDIHPNASRLRSLQHSLNTAEEGDLQHIKNQIIEIRKEIDITVKAANSDNISSPPLLTNTVSKAVVTNDFDKSIKNLSKELDELIAFADKNRSTTSVMSEGLHNLKTRCEKAMKTALTYAPNWDVGAAILWRGTEDGFGEFHAGGQALWTSLRYPVRLKGNPDKAQIYFALGLTGRAGFGEMVATGDDSLKESKADTLQGWLGGEVFTKDWRAAAHLGYVDKSFDSLAAQPFSQSGEKWQMSGDYRVHENIWLSVSYGKASGNDDALDGEKFLVGFKFSEPKAMNIFAIEK